MNFPVSDLPDDPVSDLIGGAPRVAKTPPASYNGGVPEGKLYEQTCGKCGGSGRWHGGRSSGTCFSCGGTGKSKRKFKTAPETRAKAAVSRADAKAAKIEAFKTEFPDVWTWLDGSTFQPAVEMLADLQKYGSLFDHRIEFARRMIAKREALRSQSDAERVEREASAQVVNVDALTEAFAKAALRNKRVGLWIGDVKISPAKPGSKWAGSLYVVDKALDVYLGRVTAGRFVPSRDGVAREAAVLEIMQDPKAAAIKHGKLTGSCSVCSRTLSDPVSVANGIGPKCAEGFGW